MCPAILVHPCLGAHQPAPPTCPIPVQGRWPLFDELSALDPEVYRSLIQLKRYEGDAEDLALDFTGLA